MFNLLYLNLKYYAINGIFVNNNYNVTDVVEDCEPRAGDIQAARGDPDLIHPGDGHRHYEGTKLLISYLLTLFSDPSLILYILYIYIYFISSDRHFLYSHFDDRNFPQNNFF